MSLFCSEFCLQAAETIRYARRCCADDRIQDPLVADAIQVRLAHLISGGYRRATRRLPDAVRAEVLTANGGRCLSCNEAVATEVDHVGSDSAERGNLQGLCGPCHRAKTALRVRPMTASDDPSSWERARELSSRIDAERPARRCDDPERWQHSWRSLRRETTAWRRTHNEA